MLSYFGRARACFIQRLGESDTLRDKKARNARFSTFRDHLEGL